MNVRTISRRSVGVPAKTQMVVGTEAERLFAKARADNPAMHQAMEASERLFIGKGYKRVGVTLVNLKEAEPPRSLLARLSDSLVPKLQAQDYSAWDGSVWVTNWDDGNAATWEGNMYYVDYQFGGQYT